MPPDRQEKARLAYTFLLNHSLSQQPFSVQDAMNAAGWKKSSVRTYMFKQYRDVLQGPRGGPYAVKPEFQRISLQEFLSLVTQKRKVFSKYDRSKFRELVTYEFLLPLTREGQLRDALNDLFYADTIRRRLDEVGLGQVAHVVARNDDEDDEAYCSRLCTLIGEMFGGYSISQVSGRFRTGPLLDRAGAGNMLRLGRRYVIDETTAAVRFIVPVEQSRLSLERETDAELLDQAMIEDELERIRWLFFQLFVEAVVRTIEGEEEIWLLEEFQAQRQLYVWKRPS